MYDTHGDDDRVPVSELMYYGAREEKFVPRVLIQHSITNKETNEFVENVIASQGALFEAGGGAIVCLKVSNSF